MSQHGMVLTRSGRPSRPPSFGGCARFDGHPRFVQRRMDRSIQSSQHSPILDRCRRRGPVEPGRARTSNRTDETGEVDGVRRTSRNGSCRVPRGPGRAGTRCGHPGATSSLARRGRGLAPGRMRGGIERGHSGRRRCVVGRRRAPPIRRPPPSRGPRAVLGPDVAGDAGRCGRTVGGAPCVPEGPAKPRHRALPSGRRVRQGPRGRDEPRAGDLTACGQTVARKASRRWSGVSSDQPPS